MDTTVKTHDTNDLVTATRSVTESLTPFLHDTVVTLRAPSFVISHADGQLDGGADGFYHGDSRALTRLTAAAEGITLMPLAGGITGADRADFRALLRGLGEVTADSVVALRRSRTVSSGRLEETFEISNAGARNVRFRLCIDVATDLARMDRVRSGDVPDTVQAMAVDGQLAWSRDGFAARLHSTPAPDILDPAAGRLTYDVELGPGRSWSALVVCTAAHDDGDQFPAGPANQVPWRTPVLRSADRRFDRWLEQSVADLDRLRLTDPQSPDPDRPDQFLAAGAPWYLTLFGRDALWAARMLLPLGTDLAAGTLRTLARRQGRAVDPVTEEQPGKILHEVRRTALEFTDEFTLPPVYYGTVDATPLWITLLHDAWRWGLAPEEVEQLLPHAEAALSWMRDHGDAGGDGFLKYIDQTGRGLANQGWKDSDDAILHRDGRLAAPPIALCEVQAYAYEAARGGAALLRAFGRPGADAWEEWADRLAGRFRNRFWIEDSQGPYPAVALDRDGRPVDSVTSGFGHLLGTGLLNAEESALLAARLSAPDLDSGHGLRTLSSNAAGFNPYGYHTGSVWPHDTAIAVHGLVRAGFPRPATSLAAGLLTASAGFEARLPELYAGHGSVAGTRLAPYPTSCRPQAWAAAASVLVLRSSLGLDADVPAGTVTVAPTFAHEYGPLTMTGLQVAGRPLDVTVREDGTTSVRAPEGLMVVTGDDGRRT
ncbi:glycogen debranching N-terminal domain-containing protein [Streptomyces canus]|uniref:glycogen debranching N-terminal domain-containing protein n=1 Tax=Streptomyces canus TaxID=58343 RepID=UPI002257C108|nr:glycogen debranching N-terminal domain-containing protein [Streptomyces canus]MCX4860445.1 amylo-alpha-1,6-glucosidase [Streptomyces canus]